MRTKMRSLISGLTAEETFRSEEKLESPSLDNRSMVYLYCDEGLYNFMDQENYEQVALSAKQLEGVLDLLKEQTAYDIVYFDGRPITVTPPIHMELLVTETPPGVRGDTAQGGASKPATLETGLVLQVPLFVNEGDLIRVDTRDREYVERVSKK